MWHPCRKLEGCHFNNNNTKRTTVGFENRRWQSCGRSATATKTPSRFDSNSEELMCQMTEPNSVHAPRKGLSPLEWYGNPALCGLKQRHSISISTPKGVPTDTASMLFHTVRSFDHQVRRHRATPTETIWASHVKPNKFGENKTYQIVDTKTFGVLCKM